MTARELVLVRHAKAASAETDVDRPLADRGRLDAAAIGRMLQARGVAPQRVVVSPALRARQTWQLAADALADPPESSVDRRIYDNSRGELMAVIGETPEETATLVLVGHNPSIAELADALDDGAGDPASREALTTGYPTSGVCVFTVTGAWDDVRSATLTHFSAPRG